MARSGLHVQHLIQRARKQDEARAAAKKEQEEEALRSGVLPLMEGGGAKAAAQLSEADKAAAQQLKVGVGVWGWGWGSGLADGRRRHGAVHEVDGKGRGGSWVAVACTGGAAGLVCLQAEPGFAHAGLLRHGGKLCGVAFMP